MKLREYIDWKFALAWGAAITGSHLLRAVFVLTMSAPAMDILFQATANLGSKTGTTLSWVLGGAFTGFLLGLPQWLLLRKRLDHAGWWIVIAVFIRALERFWWLRYVKPGYHQFSPFWSIMLTYSIILLTGVLQWLVLYRRAYKRGVWIITVLVAHELAWWSEYLLIPPLSSRLLPGRSAAFYRYFGSVEFSLKEGLFGIIPGAVMSWMLNHPFDDDEPEFAIEEEG